MLRAHNAIIRDQVETHRGFEVKTVGDGFMVAFPRPASAAACAIEIQRALARHNEQASPPLKVRMGLHAGAALEVDGDYFGREVVMAARVAAQARGGEILVSEALREASLDMPLGPPRVVKLKGLSGTHRLHPVVWDGASTYAGLFEGPAAGSAPELEERSWALAALREARERTATGAGGTVALVGPAGVGKSALLTRLVDEASRDGFPVLTAHGSEVERPFAFGIARQLLEPTLQRLSDRARAELIEPPAARALGLAQEAGDEPAGYGVLAALHRLVEGLAHDSPLILAIDDLHWADDASVAWLSFMARRIRPVGILIAVAARDDEPDAAELMQSLLDAGGVTRIAPEPLSRDAVRRLIAADDAGCTEAFVEACHRASGGIPLYLKEMLVAARAEGVPFDDVGAERLRDLTPAAVRRLVLRRLRPLGPTATELARACATLDWRADVRLAGRLAGLSPGEAVSAADALCERGIFRARRPLGFAHPIMQAVVRSDTPPGRQASLHRAAADLLTEEGAPVQEVAAHLVATQPAGDPATAECLRAAAAAAMAGGAPLSALHYLERALDEPPPPGLLTDVLLEAGGAAVLAGRPLRALQLGRRALERTATAERRGRIVELLARATLAELLRPETLLDWEADGEPMKALLEDAIAELAGGQRALRYELEAQWVNLVVGQLTMLSLPMPSEVASRIARLAGEATGDSAAEREILGARAIFVACQGSAPASEVLELSRQSLEGGHVARELGMGAGYDSAIDGLIVCDAHAEAERHLVQAARYARRHGVPAAAALASVSRCDNAWRAGRLEDALEFAAESAAHLREAGEDAYVASVAGGAVCGALLMQGRMDVAESTARGIEHPRLRRHALGLAAAARGDHATAVEHLRFAQETLDRRRVWRSAGPLRPVRPDLAISLAAIGERDEARRVVEAELEVARRFGAASCIAEALRAQAAVEEDPEPLREAARVIRGSEARLVEAAVLLDLGRMTGDATALERARGIAERCGAHAIAVAAAPSDRRSV